MAEWPLKWMGGGGGGINFGAEKKISAPKG